MNTRQGDLKELRCDRFISELGHPPVYVVLMYREAHKTRRGQEGTRPRESRHARFVLYGIGARSPELNHYQSVDCLMFENFSHVTPVESKLHDGTTISMILIPYSNRDYGCDGIISSW